MKEECESLKTCHKTKRGAQKQIKNVERHRGPSGMTVYKCPVCPYFHITKRRHLQ